MHRAPVVLPVLWTCVIHPGSLRHSASGAQHMRAINTTRARAMHAPRASCVPRGATPLLVVACVILGASTQPQTSVVSALAATTSVRADVASVLHRCCVGRWLTQGVRAGVEAVQVSPSLSLSLCAATAVAAAAAAAAAVCVRARGGGGWVGEVCSTAAAHRCWCAPRLARATAHTSCAVSRAPDDTIHGMR